MWPDQVPDEMVKSLCKIKNYADEDAMRKILEQAVAYAKILRPSLPKHTPSRRSDFSYLIISKVNELLKAETLGENLNVA